VVTSLPVETRHDASVPCNKRPVRRNGQLSASIIGRLKIGPGAGEMAYNILVSDNLHQQGIDLLRQREGFHVDVKTGLSTEALKEIIGTYHGLVIRSATSVSADLLQRASSLKVIGRAGTGLDNVDVPEATRRGIVVMNTPGGNSEATAEHTISLIMSAHRHIPQAVESMKEGKWEKKKFQGREMAGRILGVIGLGKVGSIVGKLASRGLKMNVFGYDPVTAVEAASQSGVKLVPLDDIFRRSDVITVHTPLNDETRGMINAAAFEKMKEGVIVVNCARGGIIDEDALLQALESGKVAAAALDVYSISPPGEHPLAMHPRVISTPHLGASTGEAQINVAVAIVNQIIDYLERGHVTNAVNLPSIDPAQSAKMVPYLNLARRLAQFLGRLAEDGIVELEVEYHGEIAAWDLRPLTNSALVGLLSGFEGTDVNQVNAPMIAQARGIRVLETTLEESELHGSSLVMRTRMSDGTSRTVQGALIRRIGYEPRIIGIDDFVTEAVPAGPMLIVTNRDIPGMIAGMSGALAGKKINIGQMNLSRDCIGGMAMSIINIDAPADKSTLDNIRNIEGIISVKQVILDSGRVAEVASACTDDTFPN
jgi:D-3-phosphoglycerate dehydrogenase / 2-oxoglutarate reductase